MKTDEELHKMEYEQLKEYANEVSDYYFRLLALRDYKRAWGDKKKTE